VPTSLVSFANLSNLFVYIINEYKETTRALITYATFCDDRSRGLGVARGRISHFPIDLRHRPYNALALLRDCVIYNNRTLRISGSRVSACNYGSWGNVYWTAGQRIDPSRNTTFIWRVKSTDANSETVSQMSYTNWHSRQPDFDSQAQSCMILCSGRSYTWDDNRCSRAFCSVCELDI